MDKLLVIFTGGTIGTKVQNGQIALSGDGAYDLIEGYSKSAGNKAVFFETAEPMQILSENLTIPLLNQLVQYLKTIDFSDYQGVIITHGSDTLAYTANILGILLAGVSVPVVLIASNKPLDAPDCDGRTNFAHAVDFIVGESMPGVFCLFQKSGCTGLYLATRIQQSTPFLDHYESVGGLLYGCLNGQRRTWYEHPDNPSKIDLKNRTGSMLLDQVDCLAENILWIKPHIGLNYNYFYTEGLCCVLHELYHCSTANTEASDNKNILTFLSDCQKRGIPVFGTPFKHEILEDAYTYESTNRMLKKGMIPITNMSGECAYAKLSVAFGLFHEMEQVKQFMNQTIFFERIVHI